MLNWTSVAISEPGREWNVLRFKRYWMTCLRCRFAEQQRWDVKDKHLIFSYEVYEALRVCAQYADHYTESLLQGITIQFRIAAGERVPGTEKHS